MTSTAGSADSLDALLEELALDIDVTRAPLASQDRFAVLGTLGRGAFGAVFEAVDEHDGRRVALKLLREGTADALLRFKREFRSLADLRHDNLVHLYELLQLGEQWVLVMELIDGVPFDVYAANHPDRLRALVRQLVAGVGALHAAGKLHRDLKPSNVLVERGGRVVILDFGLVRERTEEGLTAPVGTPAYMAPEQSKGTNVGPAVDWYAVGGMLFQALSGRLPFEGSTLEVLQQKHREPPPPLEVEDEELAALAMRLLARRPEDRPSGGEIARLVGAEEEPASAGAHELFIGRQEELAHLDEALCRVEAEQAWSVFVHGPSGMGKSALLAAFAARARARGALVLSGRCYERETVPFKAVDGLVDALSLHLRRLSPRQAAAVLPRGVHSLATLFPVLEALGPLDDVARQPPADASEERRRGFIALKELLGALADGRTVVVLLDDLQWGDEDSARLLAELLGPPDPPRMLLVGAYRHEEASESPLLRELMRTFTADASLEIGALSPEATSELAERLVAARGYSGDLTRKLAGESAGHPLFLRQLVEHVGERRDSGPVSLHAVLEARLATLPAAHRALLETLALAGRPTAPSVVAAATALPEEASFSEAMRRLRAEGWVRPGEPHAWLEIDHDRIARVVVASLGEEKQRRLHRRLASALVDEGGPPDAIAESYLRAEQPELAVEYAKEAATRSAAKLAFDQAARWYGQALALVEEGAETPLRQRLADALARAGRGAEAAEEYLRLARQERLVNGATVESFRWRQRASKAYLGAGFHRRGLAVLRPLLRDLEVPMPSSRVARLARTAMRIAEFRVRDLSLSKRPPEVPSPLDEVRYDALAEGGLFLSMFDTEQHLFLHLEAMAIALACRSPGMLARQLVTYWVFERRRERIHRLLRDLDALETPDLRTEMLVAGAPALTLLFRGELEAHVDRFERLEARFRERMIDDDHWDLYDQFRRYALDLMGEYRRMMRLDEPALRRAVERGRPFPQAFIRIHAPFHLALGRDAPDEAEALVLEARAQFEEAPERFAILDVGEGGRWVDLALHRRSASDAARGRRLLRSASSQIRFLPLFTADFGIREALLDLAFWRGDDASLRRVERRARRVEALPVLFAAPQAAALRAGIAQRRGWLDEAERQLDEAVRGFDRARMKMHAAACRLRRGELVGGDEGKAWIAVAEATMREEGVSVPRSFADRFVPQA